MDPASRCAASTTPAAARCSAPLAALPWSGRATEKTGLGCARAGSGPPESVQLQTAADTCGVTQPPCLTPSDNRTAHAQQGRSHPAPPAQCHTVQLLAYHGASHCSPVPRRSAQCCTHLRATATSSSQASSSRSAACARRGHGDTRCCFAIVPSHQLSSLHLTAVQFASAPGSTRCKQWHALHTMACWRTSRSSRLRRSCSSNSSASRLMSAVRFREEEGPIEQLQLAVPPS